MAMTPPVIDGIAAGRLPADRPHPGRADHDVLVGRSDELAELRNMIEEVRRSRGGSVVIEGEPGIGKSALVRATLAHAPAMGIQVWRTAGDELSQQFPLRALTACFGDGIPAALTETSGFGDPVPAAIERLLAHVDRSCAKSPVVLVLDDLQWADEPSLLAWHRLSQAVDQLPLLLMAAARPVPRRPEVSRLRRALASEGTSTIRLGPLPNSDLLLLAARLLGSDPGPALARLAERAGGNPLYLGEMVDALVREGAVPSVPQGEFDVPHLPASLAEAITERLAFLSEPTTQVLRLAALLGAEFSITDLATVLGRSPTDLIEPVEEAFLSGVAIDSDAGARLAFRHPLIRHALYAATPIGVRSALHVQAARALASAGTPIDRVAQQLISAGDDATDDWMLTWLAGHATQLANQAPQIAEELLQRTIDRVPVTDPRYDLLGTLLAELRFRLDRYDEAIELAGQMLSRPVEPPLKARLMWTLTYAMARTGRHDEVAAELQTALADPHLPPAGVLRLRAMEALNHYASGRPTGDWTLGETVVADAQRSGDNFAAAFALHGLSLAALAVDTAAAFRFIDRALVLLGEDPQSVSQRLVMLSNKISALIGADRIDEARLAVREFVAISDRGVTLPRFTHTVPIWLAYLTGEWDDAVIGLETVFELEGEPDRTDYEAIWTHGLRALIAVHRDDRAVATWHAAVTPQLPEGTIPNNAVYLVLAKALIAERSGHLDNAIAALVPKPGPRYLDDLATRSFALPQLVRLTLATGDTSLARIATEAAEAAVATDPTPDKHIAAHRCRGLLDNDPDALVQAVERCRAATLPLRLAGALEDSAVVHAQRDDLRTARADFREAADIYADLGATWDITRSEARLHPMGIRRGSRGTRRRPTSGWAALTPTELKVADLITGGLSNPDIAAELYLSRRTVQTHVSSILSKLGARSRLEIVRETDESRG